MSEGRWTISEVGDSRNEQCCTRTRIEKDRKGRALKRGEEGCDCGRHALVIEAEDIWLMFTSYHSINGGRSFEG